ncbi:MAG: TetR/AcrR family transcriptional regulator [Myxococcota bacterium]
MQSYSKTQTSILDVAQALSQTRGFNGFSYRDVADRIGIRAASIHHHFRTKGDLGVAMTERYRVGFMDAVADLEANVSDPVELLQGFARLFMSTLESGRMCLCGTLAVEFETLDAAMQSEVKAFFRDNERWLARVFGRAQEEGRLSSTDSPERLATSFFSTLEGAMMSARALGESRRLLIATDEFLGRLSPDKASS